MAKRKRTTVTRTSARSPSRSAKTDIVAEVAPQLVNKAAGRNHTQPNPAQVDANPETNSEVLDGKEAVRASPDAGDERVDVGEGRLGRRATNRTEAKAPSKKGLADRKSLDVSSELSDAPESPAPHPRRRPTGGELSTSFLDNAADVDDLETDPEDLISATGRSPPVNSSYLPLPWKGRLGYACLNTYLRSANPPTFSSRTCRIASILENRHPLKDPSQPAHATKNRPDKDQPADVRRGQAFVEGLGIANALDIPRMLRWNERYGIRFLRLSSEMFPFASHPVYGYRLAPFAAEALAEAGRVAAEHGHRLSTHPGQFTQLGSPRQEVIEAAFRDLDYHAELLSLLKLPSQLDKDAVMILHMGGVFGDKEATLERFRKNYAPLGQNIKNRLVLENDDVCYSVHDLLPICEELNIPLVLDFHHHNIIFDADKIREGTLDIMDLYPRILATWKRKGITPKMHYSEPTAGAITGRQRRKHNPRPSTLPPCPVDMDLMIEAKDKEQAVFELMRTYKLPGFDRINDIVPHVREDENKEWKPPAKRKIRSKMVQDDDGAVVDEGPRPPPPVADDDVGMGGPLRRVYWPPGMEEWLRPKRREVKKKNELLDKTAGASASTAAPAKKRKAVTTKSAGGNVVNGALPSPDEEEGRSGGQSIPAPKRNRANGARDVRDAVVNKPKISTAKKQQGKTVEAVPTPSTSDSEDLDLHGHSSDMPLPEPKRRGVAELPSSRRSSARRAKKTVSTYAENDEEV